MAEAGGPRSGHVAVPKPAVLPDRPRADPVAEHAAHAAAAAWSSGASWAGRAGAPDGVELPGSLGPGEPLGVAERPLYESFFWRSFADVRVHRGPEATASASAFGTVAWSAGSHIVWSDAGPARDTVAGRHVLAHELAHVARGDPGVNAFGDSLPEASVDWLWSAWKQASEAGDDARAVFIAREFLDVADPLRDRERGRTLVSWLRAHDPASSATAAGLAWLGSVPRRSSSIMEGVPPFQHEPVLEFTDKGRLDSSASKTTVRVDAPGDFVVEGSLGGAIDSGREWFPGSALVIAEPLVSDAVTYIVAPLSEPLDGSTGSVGADGVPRRLDFTFAESPEGWRWRGVVDTAGGWWSTDGAGFRAELAAENLGTGTEEGEVFRTADGALGFLPLTPKAADERWRELDRVTLDTLPALETGPGQTFVALRVAGQAGIHTIDERYFRGREALREVEARMDTATPWMSPEEILRGLFSPFPDPQRHARPRHHYDRDELAQNAVSNPDIQAFLLIEVDRPAGFESGTFRQELNAHPELARETGELLYERADVFAREYIVNGLRASEADLAGVVTDASVMARWVIAVSQASPEERALNIGWIGVPEVDQAWVFAILSDTAEAERVAGGAVVDRNGTRPMPLPLVALLLLSNPMIETDDPAYAHHLDIPQLQEWARAQKVALERERQAFEAGEFSALTLEGPTGDAARARAYRRMGFTLKPTAFPHTDVTDWFPDPLAATPGLSTFGEQLFANTAARHHREEQVDRVVAFVEMSAIVVAGIAFFVLTDGLGGAAAIGLGLTVEVEVGGVAGAVGLTVLEETAAGAVVRLGVGALLRTTQRAAFGEIASPGEFAWAMGEDVAMVYGLGRVAKSLEGVGGGAVEHVLGKGASTTTVGKLLAGGTEGVAVVSAFTGAQVTTETLMGSPPESAGDLAQAAYQNALMLIVGHALGRLARPEVEQAGRGLASARERFVDPKLEPWRQRLKGLQERYEAWQSGARPPADEGRRLLEETDATLAEQRELVGPEDAALIDAARSRIGEARAALDAMENGPGPLKVDPELERAVATAETTPAGPGSVRDTPPPFIAEQLVRQRIIDLRARIGEATKDAFKVGPDGKARPPKERAPFLDQAEADYRALLSLATTANGRVSEVLWAETPDGLLEAHGNRWEEARHAAELGPNGELDAWSLNFLRRSLISEALDEATVAIGPRWMRRSRAKVNAILGPTGMKAPTVDELGSTRLRSDDDRSVRRKDGYEGSDVVRAGNAWLRSRLGREPGEALDHNLYTRGQYAEGRPELRTPAARSLDTGYQDALAFAKTRRYMDDPTWKAFVERIRTSLADDPVQLATVEEALTVAESLTVEHDAAVRERVDALRAKLPGTSEESLQLRAENDLYVERLVEVERETRRDEAAWKTATPEQRETMRAELDFAQGKALMYASEPYLSRGAFRDVVLKTQGGNLWINLTPEDSLASFTEQYGDAQKVFGRSEGAPLGSVASAVAKYLQRMIGAGGDLGIDLDAPPFGRGPSPIRVVEVMDEIRRGGGDPAEQLRGIGLEDTAGLRAWVDDFFIEVNAAERRLRGGEVPPSAAERPPGGSGTSSEIEPVSESTGVAASAALSIEPVHPLSAALGHASRGLEKLGVRVDVPSFLERVVVRDEAVHKAEVAEILVREGRVPDEATAIEHAREMPAFVGQDGTVHVSAGLEPHLEQEVLTHEMIHTAAHTRMRFKKWIGLNEAITQRLTRDLLGIDVVGYPGHVTVADALVGLVGEELLLAAYFRGEVGPLRAAVDAKLGRGRFGSIAERLADLELEPATIDLEPAPAAPGPGGGALTSETTERMWEARTSETNERMWEPTPDRTAFASRSLTAAFTKADLEALERTLTAEGLKKILGSMTADELRLIVDEIGAPAVADLGAEALSKIGRELNPTEIATFLRELGVPAFKEAAEKYGGAALKHYGYDFFKNFKGVTDDTIRHLLQNDGVVKGEIKGCHDGATFSTELAGKGQIVSTTSHPSDARIFRYEYKLYVKDKAGQIAQPPSLSTGEPKVKTVIDGLAGDIAGWRSTVGAAVDDAIKARTFPKGDGKAIIGGGAYEVWMRGGEAQTFYPIW